MNLSYNKGAISKLMVINVLLILLITATVFILLVPRDEGSLPKTISTSPATTKPSQSISPASADSQAEIDALKKQLASETTRLQILRVDQQQQLEAERNAPELDVAIIEEAQPAGSSGVTPEIVQDSVDQAASGAPETETPAKNQGE
jgi:hypothetical protein